MICPVYAQLSTLLNSTDALRELDWSDVGRTLLLVSIAVPSSTHGVVESPKRKMGLDSEPT
jgi:hypothetical protein